MGLRWGSYNFVSDAFSILISNHQTIESYVERKVFGLDYPELWFKILKQYIWRYTLSFLVFVRVRIGFWLGMLKVNLLATRRLSLTNSNTYRDNHKDNDTMAMTRHAMFDAVATSELLKSYFLTVENLKSWNTNLTIAAHCAVCTTFQLLRWNFMFNLSHSQPNSWRF